MPASWHGRTCDHHPDLTSPGDMGPEDLPERAGQGPASPALLVTRPWRLKIEQVHDSDLAMVTIPSQKDEGLGLLGRARRVLLCSSRAGGPSPHTAAQIVQPHETHPGRWRLWRDPPSQPPTGELGLVSRCRARGQAACVGTETRAMHSSVTAQGEAHRHYPA